MTTQQTELAWSKPAHADYIESKGKEGTSGGLSDGSNEP